MSDFLRPFRATGFIFQPNRHLLLQQITKHASAIKGRTLDVGCGPVSRYQDLFRNSSEYIKMDIAPGKNVDVVGFAEAIPFGEATFDSIVCTETIHAVLEPMKGFVEFARVLKKGGTLMVTAPMLLRQADDSSDNWRMTRHSLRSLAEKSGFVVEVLEQRGAFWSTMTQLSISYWILRLRVYGAWYERLFGIFASITGKFSMWLDRFEKEPLKSAFTNGYIMIARKS